MKRLVTTLLLILSIQYLSAKSIVLDSVQTPDNSPTNHIIEEVISHSDSISSSKSKLYLIAFTDEEGGFYVSVSLCKSNKIPDAKNYIGYTKIKNNTFVFAGDKNTHKLAKSAKKKAHFTIESLTEGLVTDGTTEWLFFVKGNNYTNIYFKDSW
jgi:hypothetical protein